MLLSRLPQLKQLDNAMIEDTGNEDAEDDNEDDDVDTAADSDHAANASHRILSGIQCVSESKESLGIQLVTRYTLQQRSQRHSQLLLV